MSALMQTYARLPVTFSHGEGVYLYDTDGRRYLDGISGIAVNGLGHGHPAVTAAIREQADKLVHTSNLYRIEAQEQLAEALIEYDLLLQSAPASDPRLLQTLRRTEVIRERIWQERQSLASSDNAEGGLGADYPSLIAEYESLLVDRQIAEETYAAALQALDIARNNAQRQSRYLATYIQPTLSEDSEYPRFVVVIGLSALFLVLFWSIAVLIFYSVRDRG